MRHPVFYLEHRFMSRFNAQLNICGGIALEDLDRIAIAQTVADNSTRIGIAMPQSAIA